MSFLRPLCLLVLMLLPGPVRGAEAPARKTPRILFLGDSNTYAGHYITYLEAWHRRHHPNEPTEFLNLGLPSETASGLSEPAHPFPRPCVHERLDRALEKTRPNVVFIAYGMNDGIYYPLTPEHLAAYEKGLQEIVDKVKAIKGIAILLTPPPFEAAPLKAAGKLKPAGEKEYAWFAPYENYDDTLAEFSKSVLKLGGVATPGADGTKKAALSTLFQGLDFDLSRFAIDTRTPLVALLREKQKADPNYHLAGDGIHFNADGHEVIARTIWKELELGPADPGPLPPPEVLKLSTQRQELLRDAWLTHVGHKRPGVAAGEPLEAAQVKAAELLKKIDAAK